MRVFVGLMCMLAVMVAGCKTTATAPTAKTEEIKKVEVKAEAPKKEEVKAEAPKAEEAKKEEPKQEEVKKEEPKPELPKLDGLKPLADVKVADLEAGLTGEYFKMDTPVEDFPKITAEQKATVVQIDKQINAEGTDSGFMNLTNMTDDFFVRWTGILNVEKDGIYKFALISDDGSRLTINKTLAVDNGGLHGMGQKESGAADLKAGAYEIQVDFFERGGGAGCKLLWAQGDAELALIPESALFHKKAK